ncbi:ABC transporter substrate-binding protein [Promicromonospora iranensis]|uniref:Multiple sugar transport system substrate-binding protein n=1 Tax=Promicromonospora iranensis TaxID=1105144 RepID=A0ABU2CUJ0_9MICO|nr:sugar ABC transporter substrate-binding protein [Promicromonospora iranensis]MDR7385009.1 multiple sugar transport system substrate-binding protein [Promicromonospora iranensis]
MKRIRRTAAGTVASTVAVAVTLTLAACGVAQPQASTELADEPVTLRVTWWGGDTRHARTQEVFDLFEEEHPNITIEPEFSDWSGYWEKLATATAGGNAPDVIQMDQVYLASYASRGSLVDLSTMPQLDTSGLEPSVLEMGKWKDALYAMPVSTTSTGLLVNTDLVEEIGVSLPDTSTWSWDQFEAWAQQFSEKSPDGTYGTSVIYNEFSLQLFARQQGDQLFSEDDIVIEPETLADYFQLALDWTKDGAAPSASITAETLTLPLDQGFFATGKTAAIFTPSTMITAYSAAMGGAELELVPLPTPDEDTTKYDYYKPGMYWSVSAKSEHPAEAALLVDFMVNDAEAAKIIGTERGIPANAATLEALGDDLTPEERKAADFAEQRASHLGEAPAIVPNGASDIETILSRYLQDVMFERQTPEDAANALIAEVRSSTNAAN